MKKNGKPCDILPVYFSQWFQYKETVVEENLDKAIGLEINRVKFMVGTLKLEVPYFY